MRDAFNVNNGANAERLHIQDVQEVAVAVAAVAAAVVAVVLSAHRSAVSQQPVEGNLAGLRKLNWPWHSEKKGKTASPSFVQEVERFFCQNAEQDPDVDPTEIYRFSSAGPVPSQTSRPR